MRRGVHPCELLELLWRDVLRERRVPRERRVEVETIKGGEKNPNASGEAASAEEDEVIVEPEVAAMAHFEDYASECGEEG